VSSKNSTGRHVSVNLDHSSYGPDDGLS